MAILSVISKLLNLNQEHTLKTYFFLPNFGHITASTYQEQKLWHNNLYFKNTFILRKPKVANFVAIIKIAPLVIKTTFTDSKKSERN